MQIFNNPSSPYIVYVGFYCLIECGVHSFVLKAGEKNLPLFDFSEDQSLILFIKQITFIKYVHTVAKWLLHKHKTSGPQYHALHFTMHFTSIISFDHPTPNNSMKQAIRIIL